MKLKAGPDRCEEASVLSGASYIPCNAPATQIIGWPRRPGEPDIRMCDMCAYHNIRNRGAERIRAFNMDAEQEIPE